MAQAYTYLQIAAWAWRKEFAALCEQFKDTPGKAFTRAYTSRSEDFLDWFADGDKARYWLIQGEKAILGTLDGARSAGLTVKEFASAIADIRPNPTMRAVAVLSDAGLHQFCLYTGVITNMRRKIRQQCR